MKFNAFMLRYWTCLKSNRRILLFKTGIQLYANTILWLLTSLAVSTHMPCTMLLLEQLIQWHVRDNQV